MRSYPSDVVDSGTGELTANIVAPQTLQSFSLVVLSFFAGELPMSLGTPPHDGLEPLAGSSLSTRIPAACSGWSPRPRPTLRASSCSRTRPLIGEARRRPTNALNPTQASSRSNMRFIR